MKITYLTSVDLSETFDLTFVSFHKWSPAMIIVSKFGQNQAMNVDVRAYDEHIMCSVDRKKKEESDRYKTQTLAESG